MGVGWELGDGCYRKTGSSNKALWTFFFLNFCYTLSDLFACESVIVELRRMYTNMFAAVAFFLHVTLKTSANILFTV